MKHMAGNRHTNHLLAMCALGCSGQAGFIGLSVSCEINNDIYSNTVK